MRALILGASGMVGMGVLLECLDDERVTTVLVVGRSNCGVNHAKMTEVLHADLHHPEPLAAKFAGVDACFFCVGVTSAGMTEAAYHHVTYELTMAVAGGLAAASPQAVFCFVSGEGTDSSERGPVMWAREKGKTENALLRLPFKAAYMFRPGVIQPMRGVRSKTRLYQAFYDVLGFVVPALLRVLPRYVTTTVRLGRAMIQAAIEGAPKRVLNTADINLLAGS